MSTECSYAQVLNQENEEVQPKNVEVPSTTGYYRDFQTIDWLKDLYRDKIRHKELERKPKSFWKGLSLLFDSASGWICVLFVGLFTGLTAALVDIASAWMFDLKIGICKDAFYLNQEQCCWTSNNSNLEHYNCDQWYSWSKLFTGKDNDRNSYFIDYGLFTLWALLFSSLAVRFIITYAPYACGSGIPEIKTILSGFIIRGYLGKWTLLIKSIGMVLAVSAGLCLGKEGPMVHMAVCWGNLVSYFFPKYGKNEAKKREIMSAAAAAGVAVAFGSPIGGVLFSLEEASYYFPLKTMFRSFFCALVAANVVRIMNPFGDENLMMFNLDYKAQWHAIELIPFAFLGMLGGLFGVFFNKGNIWICGKRKTSNLGKFPSIEVFLVTLLTAIISFPQLYMKMNANELIRAMVTLCHPGDNISLCDYNISFADTKSLTFGSFKAGPALLTTLGMLSLALFCKCILSTYSFGMKVPCGLFIPSLTVGALMGRIMGVAVEQIAVFYKDSHWLQQMCKSNEPCINPGLYAVVGAAACLGGVTRITVSLVVIMLEVTGGSSYILPLMVATMVSKWTGDRMTHTIYDEHIKLNNYPFLKIDNEVTQDVMATDIMKPNSPEEPLHFIKKNSMTVLDIKELLVSAKVYGYPVVESQQSQYLIGMVTKCDLEWALERVPECDEDSILDFCADNISNISSRTTKVINMRHILDLSPITVSDHTPVETVFDFFIKLGVRQIMVTKHGLLKGIITKKDILKYAKTLNRKSLKRGFCC